jgi:hypothetical protein
MAFEFRRKIKLSERTCLRSNTIQKQSTVDFSCEAERHLYVASVKHQPSLGSWIFWDVVVYTRIDMTLGPSFFSRKAR